LKDETKKKILKITKVKKTTIKIDQI